MRGFLYDFACVLALVLGVNLVTTGGGAPGMVGGALLGAFVILMRAEGW